MSLRLHELHPSIVHFPLALLPASLVLDTVGHVTGSRGLMDAARALAIGAVAAGGVAGVAGLIAQQSVRAEGEAHDALVTHRNLNIALLGMTAALAGVRATRERPGLLYLLAGFAGVAGMNYTAYLGGKMVYTHGVGIEQRGGVREEQSIEIRRGTYARASRMALVHVAQGLVRVVKELLKGEFAPLLKRGRTGMVPSRRSATAAETFAAGTPERYSVTRDGELQRSYGSSFHEGRDTLSSANP